MGVEDLLVFGLIVSLWWIAEQLLRGAKDFVYAIHAQCTTEEVVREAAYFFSLALLIVLAGAEYGVKMNIKLKGKRFELRSPVAPCPVCVFFDRRGANTAGALP